MTSRLHWTFAEGFHFGASRLGRWVIDPFGGVYHLYLNVMEQGGVYPRSHQQSMGTYGTLAKAKAAALKANRVLLRTQGPEWKKAPRQYAGKMRRW